MDVAGNGLANQRLACPRRAEQEQALGRSPGALQNVAMTQY